MGYDCNITVYKQWGKKVLSLWHWDCYQQGQNFDDIKIFKKMTEESRKMT
jgi:hypothetical protein